MLLIITRKLKNDVFELLSISFDEFILHLNFKKPNEKIRKQNKKNKKKKQIKKKEINRRKRRKNKIKIN